MATSITSAAAEAMANALNTTIGTTADLVIYDGTPPTNAGTALGSNNALVTFDLANLAFDSTTGGVMTLDVTPALTEAADASGTATFFRILAGGTTAVLQGSVGISGSGADLIVNTTTITNGVNVTVTSGTVTMPTS